MSLRIAYRRVVGLIAEGLFEIPSKSPLCGLVKVSVFPTNFQKT